MAAGVGSLTITSIPENCTIKKYVSPSWVDCSIPLTIQSSSAYVRIGIFDNDGLNITEKCGLYSSDGSAFRDAGGIVEKVKDYNSAFNEYYIGYTFRIMGMDNDGKAIITLEDSSNSIGNIPMGELTFNGVQSVTYNGTDYTKLVVDGTSYPPPLISFSMDRLYETNATYQAEEGMTWAEWLNSKYNIPVKYKSVGDTYIRCIECGGKVYKSSDVSTVVKPSDIIENASYFEMDGPLP